MSAVVFLGPTIPKHDAVAILDADYRPPAARGDIYRASLEQPRAIGIIDGVFHSQASVWHKEILWALSRGITIFGAASMGALRAVELERFGMRGIGNIVQAYRDGNLEDDDEVAIAYSSDESTYRPTSEPMVNIRATLTAAGRAGILTESARVLIERSAKSTFYADRTLPVMFSKCRSAGLGEGELELFSVWLRNGGMIDQKRDDARMMLRAMGDSLTAELPPDPVEFVFRETLEWRRFVARHSSQGTRAESPGTPSA